MRGKGSFIAICAMAGLLLGFLPGTAPAAQEQVQIVKPITEVRQSLGLTYPEGKTLSAVIQEALRGARIERRLQELHGIQGYWSRKARERGILTERDLERYLGS